MTTRSVMGETTSLLKLLEQRIKMKREIEENREKKNKKKTPRDDLVALPHLDKDCIFSIIVRLPFESLLTSRFVCKSWYGIINSPVFADSHLRHSDVGLIFLTPAKKGLPSNSSATKIDFSVESKVSELQRVSVNQWHFFNQVLLSQIKFMEVKDGMSTIKDYNATCMGRIKATCDGLIILENLMKRRGLIVLNPVTRELKTIPLGTKSPPRLESYGFAFCQESRIYKLVHLFQDDLQYIGCEIMYIGSGSWRMVDGPPRGIFRWLGCQPIFAVGALHWLPDSNHNEYVVSMTLNDEKFRKLSLPNAGGAYDRILEMGGFLGFVSHQLGDRIDVWILRSLDGEDWAKQLCITVGCTRIMVPLYRVRVDGEIVFKCEDDDDLYAYDHRLQLMRRIQVNKEYFSADGCCFPHVNSLISWSI